MANQSSTIIDRCSKSQLKTLLSLAAGNADVPVSFLAGLRNRDHVSRLLSELLGEAEGSGEVVLSAASASETPLITLQGTKELAKTLLASAPTDAHRSTATFLYHLSVAAALARHGANISARPPSSRLALYEDLASVFAGDPLGQLFRDAIDYLDDAGKSPGDAE